MTKQRQIYKCNVCGNIVEMLHSGVGELVCCNQPMQQMVENTVDAAVEKHVPVMAEEGGKLLVKVGEVAHPMTKEHYIEWVEVYHSNRTCRKFLKPEETPEVKFSMEKERVEDVRAYCNLHGLWKGKQ